MKKQLHKTFTCLFYFLLLSFSTESIAQNIFGGEPVQVVGQMNGYNTSGTANSTYRRVSTNTGAPSSDGRGQWTKTYNAQASGGDVSNTNMSGGGGSGFLFISGPSGNRFQNKWVFSGVAQAGLNAVNGITAYNSGNDMGLNMSTAGRYTFVFTDIGYTGTNAKFYVGYTANDPVTVTRTGQDTHVSAATVSITTSATPSAGENVYVRYRVGINDFTANTSVVQATGSGTSWTATLPTQTCGTTVYYYVYTSTRTLSQINADSETDRSLAVLRYDDSSGANYSFTFTSVTAGITNNNGLALTCTVPNTTLTASGGVSYSWSNGATTAATTVSTAGTFTVTVTGANGCTAAANVSTTLNNTPPTVTAANVSGCAGSSIALSGLPSGGSYSIANPYTGPSTTYTYSYTDPANGCSATSAPAAVTVQAPANAGLDGVYTICSGTNITLAQLQAAITEEDAGGTWSPALGGAGTYTYTVAATSPCTTPDTSVVVVSAVSCQATQLSNCGSTPVLTSVNTRIFAANTVSQATLYRYRVAVSSAPSNYFYAETTYPSFRLTDVIGLTPTYGTTYNVEIQNEFLISGNTVTSAYGTLCTVTTQAVAAVTVPTNQCGQTLAAINSKIYVNGVAGATSYSYRIAKQSAPTTYAYIDTPYSNFRLTAPFTSGSVAIEHNTIYLVAVSVTTANGASNYNGECLITTPGGPMTVIQGSQCGDDETPYQIATKSTKVYAEGLVSGATYTFKLEQYDGSELVDTNYATSPINYFNCNMFTGENALLPNTNYHVYVAVNYYGEGEFDHDCVVRTPGALKQEDTMIGDFTALAYPNPFANNFMIDVKSASQSSVDLKVYDMIGRLIEQREVRVSDLQTTTIGDRYPSGVYNVVVSQENSVKTVRVVKR
ncbi:MAG: T9SS type A sorting domain-containing protein [Flavobacterium sp. JAD_PAG50586_2]|nr:MAG: T9SS type A sorting domain-containing protein [Flavobacterium sp. JAD_PAG50586_2]